MSALRPTSAVEPTGSSAIGVSPSAVDTVAETTADAPDDFADTHLAGSGGPASLGSRRRDPIGGVGASLRRRRMAEGLSLRKFATVLGVSASFISQLENGKSQPSVSTLFMICNALNVTVDELFAESAAAAAGALDTAGTVGEDGENPALPGARNRPTGPVVTARQRRKLVLDTGVTWEQLSAVHDPENEFLLITYDVGGSSVVDDRLSRHSGTDYGYVISGELQVTLGFETYILLRGDSIAFDSSTPHRLANVGSTPAQAVWFVRGGHH